MKYYNLDEEEHNILSDFEKDSLVSIENLDDEIEELKRIALNNLQKTKNINIRLSIKDLEKLKSKAASNGIPYQTLVSTLIHKYADDSLKIDL